MPWVKKELCKACGMCVDECPVDAISLEAEGAVINEQKCVRCGHCHDVCPFEAVRHDSERIPQEVQANLQWTRNLMDNFESAEERAGVLDRVRRHFNKEKKVVEQTLERLGELS